MTISINGLGGITVKIIADSIGQNGIRLTTMELNYHRYIHAEVMTHRVFSRNASSSRAIPVKTMLKQVTDSPMLPINWGSNKPGMQAGVELDGISLIDAKSEWKHAAKRAASSASLLAEDGLHKQYTNRLLEPFLAIKVLVTATEWSNFFKLRTHKDAQPEIQELARCMEACRNESNPVVLGFKEWHLPYVTDSELSAWSLNFKSANRAMSVALRSSAARCARVSYLNHNKTNCTLDGDFELFAMLCRRPYDNGKGHILNVNDPVHLSPLEHQATPMGIMLGNSWTDVDGVTHKDQNGTFWSANFRGWKQFRQLPLGQGDFEDVIK